MLLQHNFGLPHFAEHACIFDQVYVTEDRMATYIVAVIVAVLGLLYYGIPLSDPFSDRSILADKVAAEYDYIVVGAGSTGSVIAARLSEDQDKTILLLEAGGFWDENPDFHIPLRFGFLQHTRHDWEYFTEPQEHSSHGFVGRHSYWPRGRVLGGTGMINCMQYTRGSSYDFNEWAHAGCTGWSYEDILPYFKKSENIQIDKLKYSKYHGTEGPITISYGEKNNPLSDLLLKAGEEMGYRNDDYNGANMEGFSPVQSTIREGVRSSTGFEFLGRPGRKSNLDISINSFATKIEIEQNVATGIYVIRNNRKIFVKVNKEIIVSAGTINSPQLLLLSGIGPREHLQDLGIPVKVDLPVGENLQDHEALFMMTKINKSYSITPDVASSTYQNLKWQLFGRGVMSISGLDTVAFLYLDESRREKTSPDIQLIINDFMLYESHANLVGMDKDIAHDYLVQDETQHGLMTVVSMTHPKSKGSIKLKTTDPFDYPIISPEYLKEKEDIDTIIGGIRLWERFIETPTMQALGADVAHMKVRFCDTYKFRSDAYWECVARHLVLTLNHHSGTCKMGAANDPTAVVDPQLRVKGIKGLRVADASVLPNITTGNTNAPVVMIAEKCADMVRGKNTVEHLRVNT